ncbi:MAG: decapping endonuclease targeting mRNA [Watsoniomyces obsoletus]|nr:MAG: decapping endonuclease targeting mRNA [Watsoniomyces obsoletus]
MATTTTFPLLPKSRFTGSSAAIRRPQEIACFSYDDDHEYHPDDSSLRYYYPPRLGANLSDGFDQFKKLDDTADDHLDSLLKTIMELEKETGIRTVADFITWRGMMTKILITPFDTSGSFEMRATLFQGTIFIEENRSFKLAQWQSQRAQPSPHGGPSQDLMSFWGYKFETLSLIPRPWGETSREYIEGREKQVVNNHAQYCCVVKTGIGKMKMILGGEVDAVWDAKPSNKDEPINWVELKTSEEITNDRTAMKFERKLLKFWAQSFLLGVPKIIVGFRSKNGILERVQELETQTIPKDVKRKGKATWDGNICINFAASFLEWLKASISTPGVWRIAKHEHSAHIEVHKLEETGYGDILSPEFVEWREQSSPAPGDIDKN